MLSEDLQASAIEPMAPVTSSQAWRAAMDRLCVHDRPGFFALRTALPTQGRTNLVAAATPRMNVVLKTYASGGENELHAHTNEDHAFVVLQGGATFFGPRGERRDVVRHEGVVLPRGVVYRFTAHEGEPLVLLRVGAVIDAGSDPLARIDEHGQPFDGYSEKNKEVPAVLSTTAFFG
jgi:mannose-6-phosphate isomerase-like protein (cupin superfamily)